MLNFHDQRVLFDNKALKCVSSRILAKFLRARIFWHQFRQALEHWGRSRMFFDPLLYPKVEFMAAATYKTNIGKHGEKLIDWTIVSHQKQNMRKRFSMHWQRLANKVVVLLCAPVPFFEQWRTRNNCFLKLTVMHVDTKEDNIMI